MIQIRNCSTGTVIREVQAESLRGADLRRADLTGADLTGADLTGADLTGADLRRADLTGADLTGADLTGADLTGADLTGADLRRADLTGADLTHTCLDPASALSAYTDEQITARGLEVRGDQVWGWRTRYSQFVGSQEYTPRAEPYVAPYFSVSEGPACHPGIYIASREWLKETYRGAALVRCYCLRSELLLCRSKQRCKRLWVVEPEGENA